MHNAQKVRQHLQDLCAIIMLYDAEMPLVAYYYANRLVKR